jgi:hypothetical protein
VNVHGAIPPAYVTGAFQIPTTRPLNFGIIPAILNIYASNFDKPDASTFIALGIQSGTGIGSIAIAADCGSYITCPCTVTVSVQNLTNNSITGYVVAYYGVNNQVKSDTIIVQPGQKQTITLSINANTTMPVTINFVDANTGNVLATTQCTVTVKGFTYILNEILQFAAFVMVMSLIGSLISMLRRRRKRREVVIVRP